MKGNNILLRLTIFIVPLLSSCASYNIALYDTKIPVYFSEGDTPEQAGRHFKFERYLTWILFDTVKMQDLNLDEAIKAEVPTAKKIVNLRVSSSESGVDSVVRFFGTLIQYLLVADRSLVSKRTVIVEGDYYE
jgi:hypothetical protein